MRIVVSNPYQDRRGGVETYVERLMALLAAAGHDVVAAFDFEPQDGWPRLVLPEAVRTATIATDGLDATIRTINAFDDAVVLANSLDSPLLRAERRIERPLAFYAHTYVASCINGLRINRRPHARPCDKTFGPGCLTSYFPRRCGGLSPLTMLSAYRREVSYRGLLSSFDLVVANSDAVGRRLRDAGIPAETLHPFIGDEPGAARESWVREDRRSLAFLGRFEDYKGGDVLLSALPAVAGRLGVPLHLTMAGDGGQRRRWTVQAAEISRGNPGISVSFPGWLRTEEVADLLEATDVIVVPSVWPEPFGLVGLEAARFGLPAAAFAVGGIPEWLVDDVSGHLADGADCSAQSLATAIVRCLEDVVHYAELSEGAVGGLSRFTPDGHIAHLTSLLENIEL